VHRCGAVNAASAVQSGYQIISGQLYSKGFSLIVYAPSYFAAFRFGGGDLADVGHCLSPFVGASNTARIVCVNTPRIILDKKISRGALICAAADFF
jgi:hypothetical protein